jgi:hypothetical protein
MRHFTDARMAALQWVEESMRSLGIERACLLVDVRGLLRLVVWGGGDSWRGELDDGLGSSEVAGPFWTGEVWLPGRSAEVPVDLGDAAWEMAMPVGQGGSLRVLDRHLSKESWLGRGSQPPWPLGQGPPIVSFWSFKGGVGRTTVLAAVAVNAAQQGRRVVVVDTDVECPGLHSVFAPGDPGTQVRFGVVDYWVESAAIGADQLDITDYYGECRLSDGEPVIVVPAGIVDDQYLEKLARVNYEPGHPLERAPLDPLLRAVCEDTRPDLVLLDSRSGLHDMGGLAVSGTAHLQVLMGVMGRQSWDGLRLAVRHLGADMVARGLKQRECLMVHAMASRDADRRAGEEVAFRESSYDVFQELFYDPGDEVDAEWPTPDAAFPDAPHYPSVIHYDGDLVGYSHVEQVIHVLPRDHYAALAGRIWDRLVSEEQP